MRLKSFDAPTMVEAMHQVRQEFGDDAAIVSSRRAGRSGGVRVTAALEDVEAERMLADRLAPPPPSDSRTAIADALVHHGAPRRVIDRLGAAARGFDGGDPVHALAAALSTSYGFSPLPESGGGAPLALVGPPGAGKTVSIAKLAARAVLAEQPMMLVTTDGFRAGGVEQLAGFTRILGVELHTAGSPRELQQVIAGGDGGELVLIDTAGVNPFAPAEIVRLAELVGSIDAAPVLTLAAGGDAADAMEIGEVFGHIGADRQLVTRLDAARRLGAVLAAADGGHLAFCEASTSPHVSRGFRPLEPAALAHLLLSNAAQPESAPEARQ